MQQKLLGKYCMQKFSLRFSFRPLKGYQSIISQIYSDRLPLQQLQHQQQQQQQQLFRQM